MAGITLTAQQQAAVENRGGRLLVSAAAGSGKTKVLVERLFRYITAERCNVDDFLIITYTKAAAAELRGKIAAELNLPIEKIIEANRTAADTLSLDMPVGDEEDTTIGSFVEDDNTPGPVDATSNAMLSEALTEILGTLTEREADVLRMRFGMYDGRTHTLEEVGQIFGVTRERIRQIENKAIRKLRHPSRAKKIKDFYC